ncbi:MAG: (Fe-S)-binding protein [Candidatus Omnitrophota bacterium]|jgi:uncharacterized Fe-S cluster-containing protein
MSFQDQSVKKVLEQLPGLDCGMCGQKSCEGFAQIVSVSPRQIAKCVHLAGERSGIPAPVEIKSEAVSWKDSLGREYDFILDSFVNEPGPRETILPHNPARTKDLDIKPEDIIIGRPMGMSCGCPITHCGIVMDADQVNGLINWCVSGPLHPRSKEYKDIGYYAAEAYEGIVKLSNKELKIGMRYWFLPRRCMLQWRHSGLINFINKRNDGVQVRIEGLMIG